MTGDTERAEELADQALAQALARASGPGTVTEEAKAALVRAVVDSGIRPQTGEHPDLPGWQALGRLSARRRAAIVLRFDERLTEEQAAARMGIPAQSVRADVDAALLTLRTAVAGTADPWVLVSAGLTTAARRWSAGYDGADAETAPPDALPELGVSPVPSSTPTRYASGSRGAVVLPRLGGSSSWSSAATGGYAPAPAALPAAPEVELLPARGPAGPSGRRRTWLTVAAAGIAALVVLGGVLVVPALRGDKAADQAVAGSRNEVPSGGVYAALDTVPTRPVLPGLLNWPARGALAGDVVLAGKIVAAWRAAAKGPEYPVDGATVLWAGKLDGRRTAVVQALDRRGNPRIAQLAEISGAFRLQMAEPLPAGTAVLSMLPAAGPSGPVRVLVSPEAQRADGLMAVDPMSGDPLRKYPVDESGMSGVLPSPPGTPTCSRVVVLGLGKLNGRVGSGTRVLASGIVATNMMVTMGNPMNPAEVASATLAPAEAAVPDMTWFADGKVLAGKVGGRGTITVAALGPRLAAKRISADDPRMVSSRAYELHRGGRAYVGSVVELDGKRICASAWPVREPDGPYAYVVRCPIPGGTAGIVHIVGTAQAEAIDVALKPTPNPPGQRGWSGSAGPPGGQRSTDSFATLHTVAAGFPCGAGSIRISGENVAGSTLSVPVYVP